MIMRRWLPELLALPLLPWLVAQGRRTRRMTPRMPEAAGARSGIAVPAQACPELAAMSLLAIGESTVAGVGVDEQQQAITAQLASQLATRWQRPVRWQACGQNGATVADAMAALATGTLQLPTQPVQLLLVAFGVNDTTAFHSSRRYRRDLQRLLDHLQQQVQPELVIVTGVPPVHRFSALPQPLRHVLGQKAVVLTAAARELAQQRARTIFVPVIPAHPALLAYDGYHPAATGVRMWAEDLAQAVVAGMSR
jgi:lysophospholipase L1-like esterase